MVGSAEDFTVNTGMQCPDCRGTEFETSPISRDHVHCVRCDELKPAAACRNGPEASREQPLRSSDRSLANAEPADEFDFDEIGSIDAVPSKAVFERQGAAISLVDALSELIDNSIDAATRSGIQQLAIEISCSDDIHLMTYRDNAGGMTFDDIRRLLTFASENNRQSDIGHFGIGGKAAIGHLSRDFRLTTKSTTVSSDGLSVHLPREWFSSDNSDWTFRVGRVREVTAGSTRFEFRDGRRDFEPQLEDARYALSERYARYFDSERLSVVLNGEALVAATIETFVEAASYAPYEVAYYADIGVSKVEIKLTLAIIKHRSVANSGVFYFISDRLFAKDSWDDFDRRVVGRAGMRQEVRNFIRFEVTFRGPVAEIPVNAYKNGIGGNREALNTVAEVWASAIKPYFSRVIKQLSGEANFIEFLRAAPPSLRDPVSLPSPYRLGAKIAPALKPGVPDLPIAFLEWRASRFAPPAAAAQPLHAARGNGAAGEGRESDTPRSVVDRRAAEVGMSNAGAMSTETTAKKEALSNGSANNLRRRRFQIVLTGQLNPAKDYASLARAAIFAFADFEKLSVDVEDLS